jgi:hypothetical protein
MVVVEWSCVARGGSRQHKLMREVRTGPERPGLDQTTLTVAAYKQYYVDKVDRLMAFRAWQLACKDRVPMSSAYQCVSMLDVMLSAPDAWA